MGRENDAKEAPAATQGERDEAALKAENASLQDRLLRAGNTRRRAAQSAEAARQRTAKIDDHHGAVERLA
jgi:hypothetical protein